MKEDKRDNHNRNWNVKNNYKLIHNKTSLTYKCKVMTIPYVMASEDLLLIIKRNTVKKSE